MSPKGLTATIIFEGQSLNYDEGYGNLSVLKKFHRGNGQVFTYSSRQSLRYSIFLQGKEEFGWNPSKTEERGSGENTVTQLVSDIDTSEESDLFGYFRTNEEIEGVELMFSRTSPVRLLPAIALEPYASDMEMLTNKYQSDKESDNLFSQPNIANAEIHRTLYRYSICIDLHRIGSEADEIGTRFSLNKAGNKAEDEVFKKFVEKKRGEDIGSVKKKDRISQLLEVVGRLYRDIRGRREDLKPLFVIGGVYDTFNPFFENLVNVDWNVKKRARIKTGPLKQILSSTYTTKYNGNQTERLVKDDTFIGVRDEFFLNEKSDFESLYVIAKDSDVPKANETVHVGSPEYAISKLKEKVKDYYESEANDASSQTKDPPT